MLMLTGALRALPPGFLGEGDAITKAIQDARQLLHGHGGAMEGALSHPYRKVSQAQIRLFSPQSVSVRGVTPPRPPRRITSAWMLPR